MATPHLPFLSSFPVLRPSSAWIRRAPIASAAWLLASSLVTDAFAQAALETVTISAPAPSVAGWGNVPASKAPFQTSTLNLVTLRDLGAQRLSDVTRVDPSVSDAYNSEGYWDYLSVRGFVIDNRYNYQRDGLPISAETSIPLDNKDRIEVLKGTSGLQAGTSAPGGLVNLVVSRPTATPLRDARVQWRQPGSVLGAVDLSQRFGPGQAFGVRVSAAYEHLDPMLRDAEGRRHLVAIAGEWRAVPGTLIEAEVENSHRSQRSQPAFSLLGANVPAPTDPRINLNNQPWSLPNEMEANTASLRITQQLAPGWRAVAHAMSQRLETDDRLAFPFGCSAANGDYYADRYCPDGSFDLYDFRSENERRRTDALEFSLHGEFKTGTIGHTLAAGVQRHRRHYTFDRQAYNYAGTGNVWGTLITPADPSLTDENTNRDEHATELYLRDAVKLNERLTLWAGLRHTRLQRDSVRTDGSRPTSYTQSPTTPWLAGSFELTPNDVVYLSWGRGLETDVAPNRRRFSNAGQALPLESRQIEAGWKASHENLAWSLVAFDIERGVAGNLGINCADDTTPGSCTRRQDGRARHRGVDAEAVWRQGPWRLQAGVQWLHSRREGSADAAINGKQPTNVPVRSFKGELRYRLPTLPGLQLQANVIAEGRRMVLEDNSVSIPGHGRLDLSTRYEQPLGNGVLTWRAGIDNVFDRRAWRESPYQFGHAYLYPMAPRTLRLSVEVAL